MYTHDWDNSVPSALLAMPYDAAMEAADAIAHVLEDPWNYQRRPDESLDRRSAHRHVSFDEGRGTLWFLILEDRAEVFVTRIDWPA